MKKSEWEDRCKIHPEHRLSKGVCPFCLRERLAHFSASSTTNTTHASSSSRISPNSTNSNRSPGAAGAASSPPPLPPVIPTKDSSVKSSDIFQKSRSLALDVDNEKEATGQKHKDKIKKKKKKIERFFSKIIHGPSKKGEGHDLHHSRTMKESSAPKWVPF
ncbi:hypothetical protein FCM35_KLT08081 [Carex littledalei]|uniref:Uncharacterized protein n=1 Tax=Carex littledalei TaxID=544730 RepID=A0A833QX90_9POAL|nr:hypothetical protein FCM35_KLT08081 [Carex littledalei]